MRSRAALGTHQYAPKAMDGSDHQEHASKQPLSPLKCKHCPFQSISISHMKQHASHHLNEMLSKEEGRSSNQARSADGKFLLEEDDDDWSAVEAEFARNPSVYSQLFKFNSSYEDKVCDKLDEDRGNLDEINGNLGEVCDNLAVDNSPPDNDWSLIEAEYAAGGSVSAISYQAHPKTAVQSNPNELFYSEEDNDWTDLENQFAKAVTSMADYIDLGNDVETIKEEDDCVDSNRAEDAAAVSLNTNDVSYHLFDLDCLSVAHYKDERDSVQTGTGDEGSAWLDPNCGNGNFGRGLAGSNVHSAEKTTLLQGNMFPWHDVNNNLLEKKNQQSNIKDMCNANGNYSGSEISLATVNSVERKCKEEAGNHILGLPSECSETAPGTDALGNSCVVEVTSKALTVATSESRISSTQVDVLTTVNSGHQKPRKDSTRRQPTSVSLLKCRYCSFKAIASDGLELHQSKHSHQTRRTQFLCHLCPFKSFYKHHVKRHVCHRHPTSAAAKELSAPTDKNVKYALTDKRVYYCPMCPEFRSVWRRCFMRHLERHAAAGVLSCNACTYETDSPTCFNRHLRGHDKRQTFSCSECSYKTTYKKILKKHTLRYHQEVSVKKEKGEDGDQTKVGLPISYNSKLRSATRQLLPIFKTELLPVDEIEQQIATNEGFPFSKTGLYPIFKTELVPSEEGESSSTTGHVIAFPSTQQVSLTPSRKPNSKRQLVSPEHSNAPPVWAGEEKLLQVPKINDEATTPIGPDIKFSHTSSTRPVNLLKCPHCDFTTFWKKNLFRHLSFHSSASVLQCDKCPFSTYTEGAMHQHRSTHVEELLQCHLCDFRSSFKSGLKRHVTRKHFWPSKSEPISSILAAAASAATPTSRPLLMLPAVRATATVATAPSSTPQPLVSPTPVLPDTNKAIAAAGVEISPTGEAIRASLPHGVAGVSAKMVVGLGSTAEPSNMRQKIADCKNFPFTAGPYSWWRAASAPPLAVSTNPKHLGKPLYQCCFCSYSSVYGQLYRFHMARHTGQGLLHCPYCDYSCGSTGNFKKHLGVHVRRGHIRSVDEVALDGCFGARGWAAGGWGVRGGVTGLDEGHSSGNVTGLDESRRATGGWGASASRGNAAGLNEGHGRGVGGVEINVTGLDGDSGWSPGGAAGNVRCLDNGRSSGAGGGWGVEGNVTGLDEGCGRGNVTGLDEDCGREASGGGSDGGTCAGGEQSVSGGERAGDSSGLGEGHGRGAGGGGRCAGSGERAGGSSGLVEGCGRGVCNNRQLGADQKESPAVGGGVDAMNKFEAAIASGNFFFSSAAFTSGSCAGRARVTNRGRPDDGIEGVGSVATSIPGHGSCIDQSKLKNSVVACADKLLADDGFGMVNTEWNVNGQNHESAACVRKAKIREAIESAVRAPARVRISKLAKYSARV